MCVSSPQEDHFFGVKESCLRLVFFSSLALGDDDVGRRMGTKTTYENGPKFRSVSSVPDGCGPATLSYVVARHGSRHSGHIAEMNALASRLGANVNAPKWLRDWTYPYPESSDSLLASLGLEEQYNIGLRLSNFSRNISYDPLSYNIRSTYKSRAARSAEAFALGALETAKPEAPFLADRVGAAAFVNVVPGDQDLMLRFFDNCDAYEVTSSDELEKYGKSKEMMQALSAFRRAVANDNVDLQDFLLAYEACAYEYMFNSPKKSFCSLLADHVDILEYYADLENYYLNANGNALAKSAPMVLVRDIVDAIEANVTRANWRFAHAETLIPFLAMLGLFDDQKPLTADFRDTNRIFRTSRISPMAANLAIFLHECPTDRRLRFTLNEQEVILPLCQGQVYCPFDTFTTAFHDALYLWDFDTLCHQSPSSNGCGEEKSSGPDALLAQGPREENKKNDDDARAS